MRVLITGANGQLGKSLLEILSDNENYEVLAYGKDSLDITNYEEIATVFCKDRPDVVINCAAYTNVDQCEKEYNLANSINHIGAMNVARAADVINAKIVHISTDFVFNGHKKSAYFEYDPTEPLSNYGKSKLAGEWAVRNECKRHFIIRTSWLYSHFGSNFVKTMIRLGNSRDTLSVVSDQVGSPTNAKDLACGIEVAMKTDYYGTYHFSNKGNCSWCEFAQAIFSIAGLEKNVSPITSHEYGSPAERPSNSVMDSNLFQDTFQVQISDWKDSLGYFLDSYLEHQRG